MKLSFFANQKPDAQKLLSDLVDRYGNYDGAQADVIVAIGGDGFMLETLRAHMLDGKPVYGVNCGTVGFLMNPIELDHLAEKIESAESAEIHPLSMRAHTQDRVIEEAKAINEVSLLRQTRQSAHIRLEVNGRTRMEKLICDGVLLSTPAGSTAYNLSAHGPILPLSAHLLALTPISAFRPRRWRGALLPMDAKVVMTALTGEHRPVSAVADNYEVRNVERVEIEEDRSITMTLLFDKDNDLDERILREQFDY